MTDSFRLGAQIVKADHEEQFLLGVVLVPEIEDLQGDVVSAEEIRRAAHRWLEFYQSVNLMHERSTSIKVVESYLAPHDLQIGGAIVRAGSWLLGIHVTDDEVWAEVKAGRLRGFSIGGYAERDPVDPESA